MAVSTLKIINADVDGREKALGIDNTKPLFHYAVSSSENDKGISAHQVVVLKGQPEDREKQELVWDSGRITYDHNNYIQYDGAALMPKTSYYAEFHIWDEHGDAAEWVSVPFETGFMGTQWKGKWIEPEQEDAVEEETLGFFEMLVPNPKFWGGETRLRECRHLRKSIDIAKPVKKARIYASSHGIYNLYINGIKQSERRLAPENSAYQAMIYYQTYDVTDALSEGENIIAAILGDGWWIGRLGMPGDSCNYGNRLGFIMQLDVTYEDGSEETFASDESFLSSGSYIRYSDLYIGECQDLTVRDDSWMKPGLLKGEWTACVVHDSGVFTAGSGIVPSKLTAQPLEPICVTDVLEAQDIFITPAGELVIDFGQVIAGVIHIHVRGKTGQRVCFEHGEVLRKDGSYVNNILGRNKDQKDVIICREGENIFEPLFTYHGFRYVRITGLNREDIISVKAYAMGSKINEIGYFSCSNEDLNQLQHNIIWSTKANMFSVPTDCPQREKLGWTGDIQIYTQTGAFNYDLRCFLKAWLMNMRAEQCENGEIPVVVPNPSKQERTQRVMSGGSNSSSVWGDACVMVPWYLYEAYGDITALEENYEMMKKWMGYIRDNCELKPEGYARFTPEQKARNPYLWTKQYHFGDWLIPSLRSLPDGVQRGTEETAAVVGSAYYAFTASYFAKVCRALGKEEEASEYEKLVPKIQNAVREEFVADDGSVNNSSLQGLYVMILRCGIVEGELKKKVLDKLVTLIEDNAYCLDTGFSSVSYLLDVLAENGRTDIAYKMLYQTKAPGWLYMVKNGATTMWENWLAILPDGSPTDSSYNHYAFGCVGDFIYRHIGGIQKAAPGYEKIRFAPDFGCGLTVSKCSIMTPFGQASLEWNKTEDGYEIQGKVPVGASACLEVGNMNVELTSGEFMQYVHD